MTRLRHGDGEAAIGLAVVIVAWLSSASPAFAQEPPALRAHHVTVGASVVWSGAYDVGDATAQLRGNAVGATATPFNWFSSSSRVTSSVAPEVHVGFAVTPTVAIDGGFSYAKPRIAVAISGDAETATQELPGEQIEQYQIGAGMTWQLPIGMGARLAPFVSVGGTYLRQLHEDRALAETGQVYHAGAGARYWFKGGHGAAKGIGLRADAQLNVRSGGIDFENKTRTYPSVALMLFVGL